MSAGRSVLLLVLVGCAPEGVARVGIDGWTPVEAPDDPLASHRPERVSCPAPAVAVEDGVFEVQTGICTYLAVEQPLPRELRPRDRIVGAVWHEGLDAAEPGEAHVALWVDDVVVWEAYRPIPDAATLLEIDVEIDAPASDRIGFHLHNHGYNAWNLTALEIVPR
ncbi:MAG: hypothetical protein R3F61_04200 [Myxococcota bacterium]